MTSPDYLVQLDPARDGSWSEDATDRVRSGGLTRGVGALSGPLVRANAGTARVALDNRDAAYDQGTAVPLRTPLRILGPAHDVDSAVFVSPGGSLDAPDSAALTIAGDLDLRVRVTWLAPMEPFTVNPATPTDPGSNAVRLVEKSGSYIFYGSTQRLVCVLETDVGLLVGAVGSSAFPIEPPIPQGVPVWVRVTVDLDDGTGGTLFAFYWSLDGSSWTQVAAESDSDGPPTSITDGGADTRLAYSPTSTGGSILFHEALLADGGGAYCTVDATALARRSTSVASTEGDTFTLDGSAVLLGGTGRPVMHLGRVEGWGFTYPADGHDAVAEARTVDARDELAGMILAAVTPVGASERTDLRLARILDAAGWTRGRVLDPGAVGHAATTLAGDVWAQLQLTADSTGGDLWLDGEGRVVYSQLYAAMRNAYRRVLVLELADDGTGVPYAPTSSVELDGARRVNRALLAHSGGSQVLTEDDTAVAADGPATFERNDLNVDADDLVANLGGHLVGTFATPRPRLGKLAVHVHRLDAATQAAVLALDLGDRVQVTHDAPGAVAPWVTEQVVRGVQDTWTEGVEPTYVRTLTLEDAELYDRWVLGDATYGVLGSTTRLA